MTMSWVAEAVATRRAAPKTVYHATLAGSQKAMSDLYFVRVRPLQKDFKKAESQGGGGGGGQQQNQVGALSEQERQIIAATFNIQRDRKTSGSPKLGSGTRSLTSYEPFGRSAGIPNVSVPSLVPVVHAQDKMLRVSPYVAPSA